MTNPFLSPYLWEDVGIGWGPEWEGTLILTLKPVTLKPSDSPARTLWTKFPFSEKRLFSSNEL